jgi:hypothetical protein
MSSSVHGAEIERASSSSGTRRPGLYGLVFVPGPGAARDEPARANGEDWPPGMSQAPPGSLYAVLEDLTRYPGRWAIVVTYRGWKSASALATDLRAGRRPVPGGGTFTFAGPVGGPGGESHLYALFSSCAASGPDAGPEGGCDGRRSPFVPAVPVARHVQALADRGVGLRAVASEAGLSLSTLSRLVYGKSGSTLTPARRVQKTTAIAILAVGTTTRALRDVQHA